jgi:hypothetical protein
MCRIGAQHLTNFWPVILSELVRLLRIVLKLADSGQLRIFESTMDDPPPDGSEALQLVLAACKFLDLLLVIQSEDFQMLALPVSLRSLTDMFQPSVDVCQRYD